MHKYLHMCYLLGHDEAVVADKSTAGGLDTLYSVGSQWDIGRAGVAPIDRPLGLAMADDEDSRCRHAVLG